MTGPAAPRTGRPRLGLFWALACIALPAGISHAQSAADSLPAFKPDSAAEDPFRKVEAGPSPWSAAPAAAAAPKTRADSLARTDTVTAKLRKRHPAVSACLGVDFFDLDAKEVFKSALEGLETERANDSLKVLQDYDPVHLAFPIGLQAILPLGAYVDLVVKTHSYWYKQTAILGDKNSRHVGDEWFAVQANLGGAGLRYYVPPALLSVTGGLGLFAQGVLYWNLGRTELYTPYGSAAARFRPYGSGYEIQFGIQQSLAGPWQLAGAIGFLRQDFKSRRPWTDIVRYSAPAGNAHWESSAVQASLNLWYHFGARSPSIPAPSDSTLRK
ncbi:MAG TPA: hypothetical protein VJ385_18060 [Fibrobacteria bacterium]|nr:hypothetical protein [Fibrobacteria bacterium]